MAPPVRSERVPWFRSALTARLVKVGFGIAVVVFGVVYVSSRWDEMRKALSMAKPGWIVAAVLFAIAGQWAASASFRNVLASVARRLPVLAVARVYFVSQLGKYIPGSVWPLVAVTQMCQRFGVARRAAAAAGVLALLFSLVTAGVVGAVVVVVGAAGSAAGLWWLLLIIPVAFLLVNPRVIVAALNFVMRVIRRPAIQVELTPATLGRALGWSALSWVLLGVQCWALVVALGGPVAGSVAASIGGFALAYAAGTIFIPAPAGAGVREAVLALALGAVIASNSTFTHDSVIVVVLLSRVLLAMLDFGQAGVVLLLARRSADATAD